MKVLFAVSNEEISESIVKRYQKQYKEIISYKNVYYFNAILKELQKDKNYDRIVVSEELEAFTNAQFDQIDKFIFDKLDNISDEASNLKGDDIPIILLCSDRREKSEQMLVKLFGIGIYNALIGNDRTVDNVCALLNKPRLKKEAKSYYKIDTEDVTYQTESENDVNEIEIQNILAHYKRIGKDEKKYVESFDTIAAQYNDAQLRIICKFLPLNVRAVLEEQSPKYQQIISFNSKVSDELRSKNTKKNEKQGTFEKLLKGEQDEKILSRPVVVPTSVNLKGSQKFAKVKNEIKPMESGREEKVVKEVRKIGPMFENVANQENIVTEENKINIEDMVDEENKTNIENIVEEAPKKRGRGRPRKNPVPEPSDVTTPKRGRGRPRKNPLPEEANQEKDSNIEESNDSILPGLEFEQPEKSVLPGLETENNEETVLPGLEDQDNTESNETMLPGISEDEDSILPGFNDEERTILPGFEQSSRNDEYHYQEKDLQNTNTQFDDVDISGLLTSNKKVASFVGTSKNGTSFIVNNLAEITSSMGIDTAILDTTKNRNSYYIYTKNDEALRKVAMESINKLLQGEAAGIQVNKNLTVYTSLPEEAEGIENAGKILETLLKKHSLVLIDCDFETPLKYFEKSQEIYLVQTFDILTIQPLTAFLRELKSKNILKENKLKIVLNKAIKVRGVNEKTIIGGMAYYNDPAMSFMTELFDKNTIKYITIPFNEEVYSRYLENVINCEVSVKGYPKNIVQIFNELSNMVYPLILGKSTYVPPRVENNGFSASMNSTLDQMKNKY